MDAATIDRILTPYERNCLVVWRREKGLSGAMEYVARACGGSVADVQRALASAKAKIEERAAMEKTCGCGETFFSRNGTDKCPACRELGGEPAEQEGRGQQAKRRHREIEHEMEERARGVADRLREQGEHVRPPSPVEARIDESIKRNGNGGAPAESEAETPAERALTGALDHALAPPPRQKRRAGGLVAEARAILAEGPMTQRELRDRLGVSSPEMTRVKPTLLGSGVIETGEVRDRSPVLKLLEPETLTETSPETSPGGIASEPQPPPEPEEANGSALRPDAPPGEAPPVLDADEAAEAIRQQDRFAGPHPRATRALAEAQIATERHEQQGPRIDAAITEIQRAQAGLPPEPSHEVEVVTGDAVEELARLSREALHWRYMGLLFELARKPECPAHVFDRIERLMQAGPPD